MSPGPSVVSGGGGMERAEVSVVAVHREEFCSEMVLEGWMGAGQVLTSVVFSMLKGTSPQSIASRWVSRRAIFTL